MIHSMTGFGEADSIYSSYQIQITLAAVNKKNADLVFHLPRALSTLEPSLKKQVLSVITRGRITIHIQVQPLQQAPLKDAFQTERILALRDMINELEPLLEQKIQLSLESLLNIPNLITTQPESSFPDLSQPITHTLQEALDQLITMRRREGQDLEEDLKMRLCALRSLTQNIAQVSKDTVPFHLQQLHERIAQITPPIPVDDERLAKEIALFADRCDISEELTRLYSHFDKFQEYLVADQAVGRSLDFLCQELHREFNTIASKAHNATIAHHIVHAKTELEQIREQVQNIE